MTQLMSAIMPSLAWALLDFVWQGLLIGWGAALLLGMLRKARPQTRYAVACGALLLCAALPLAGMVQRVIDAQAVATTVLPLAAAGVDDAPAPGAAPMALAAGRLALWEQALQAKLPLVVFFWSCGAGLLAIRMMFGLAWVRRRSAPGQSLADPLWQARLDTMAARFGIGRPVRLGLVGDLPSPVTAGWWRPVVLVPAALVSGMPAQLLEALLAHELAHIKRHDYLVNLIQGAIEIVLFYHPTVWWLSNRIRVEREQIADDLAASMLGEPRRLALALSELDQFQLTTPQLAHAAHGGNLMSRITRLVRPTTEPLNWKMALPILGLSAACMAFYANAQVAPPAPAAPTAPPAAKAAPAIPAAPAKVTPRPIKSDWNVSKGHDVSYALVRGPERNGSTMSGNSSDWKDIETMKRSLAGDFLWFRTAGKAYVIQDPGVLARVIEAWGPVDRLGMQMEAYGKEMDQHGKVMEALGKQMETVAHAAQPGREMRDFERKMAGLGREQEQLGRQMDKLGRRIEGAGSAERERLQREMEQLGKQMEVLGRQMEQHGDSMARQNDVLDKARAPMDEIGKKMEQAGKPMDALGDKMGVLGKQMEKESTIADQQVRSLIRDALAKGLANPVPGNSGG